MFLFELSTMCYSQRLSAISAIGGWSMTWILHKNNRIITPIFVLYSLMETLQFIQYYFIDQCGTMTNYILTIFAHILVIIQPFIWNSYRYVVCQSYSNAIINRERFNIFRHLSVIWALFYTFRLLPPIGGDSEYTATYSFLNFDETMVGSDVCTHSGPTHLIWNLPYYSNNGFEANFFTYLLLWFYPAIYEENGKWKLAYWIFQILFVNFTAGSIHELPTIWCALSIPILLGVLLFDRKL